MKINCIMQLMIPKTSWSVLLILGLIPEERKTLIILHVKFTTKNYCRQHLIALSLPMIKIIDSAERIVSIAIYHIHKIRRKEWLENTAMITTWDKANVLPPPDPRHRLIRLHSKHNNKANHSRLLHFLKLRA